MESGQWEEIYYFSASKFYPKSQNHLQRVYVYNVRQKIVQISIYWLNGGRPWMNGPCRREHHVCVGVRASVHSFIAQHKSTTKPTTTIVALCHCRLPVCVCTVYDVRGGLPANCKPLQCGFNRNKIIVLCNGECICHSFVCSFVRVACAFAWIWNGQIEFAHRKAKTQTKLLSRAQAHSTVHIQPIFILCTIC